MCVCDCGYVGAHACMYVWRLDVIIRCLPQWPSTLYFWDRFSHWGWSSPIQLHWLASEFQGSPCLYHLQCWHYRYRDQRSWLRSSGLQQTLYRLNQLPSPYYLFLRQSLTMRSVLASSSWSCLSLSGAGIVTTILGSTSQYFLKSTFIICVCVGMCTAE